MGDRGRKRMQLGSSENAQYERGPSLCLVRVAHGLLVLLEVSYPPVKEEWQAAIEC
jgi:hypothetical protein